MTFSFDAGENGSRGSALRARLRGVMPNKNSPRMEIERERERERGEEKTGKFIRHLCRQVSVADNVHVQATRTRVRFLRVESLAPFSPLLSAEKRRGALKRRV